MNRPAGKPLLCPNCRKLISASERQCPYCGMASPGSGWKQSALAKSWHQAGQPLRWLVIANGVMYVISLLLSGNRLGFSANPLYLLAPDSSSLLFLGATGTWPIDQFGRWWTLLAANFLHGSLLHIFFNMMALQQLGALITRLYGVHRMLLIYLLSGVIGFLVSYVAGVRLTIGASAAVCGLIGAGLYYGKSRGGTYGQALYRQIGGWAVFIFIFGLLVPGINNWGHGGGMIGGIAAGWLLSYSERRPESAGHRRLALACAALTVLVLIWAVVSGTVNRLYG